MMQRWLDQASSVKSDFDGSLIAYGVCPPDWEGLPDEWAENVMPLAPLRLIDDDTSYTPSGEIIGPAYSLNFATWSVRAIRMDEESRARLYADLLGYYKSRRNKWLDSVAALSALRLEIASEIERIASALGRRLAISRQRLLTPLALLPHEAAYESTRIMSIVRLFDALRNGVRHEGSVEQLAERAESDLVDYLFRHDRFEAVLTEGLTALQELATGKPVEPRAFVIQVVKLTASDYRRVEPLHHKAAFLADKLASVDTILRAIRAGEEPSQNLPEDVVIPIEPFDGVAEWVKWDDDYGKLEWLRDNMTEFGRLLRSLQTKYEREGKNKTRGQMLDLAEARFSFRSCWKRTHLQEGWHGALKGKQEDGPDGERALDFVWGRLTANCGDLRRQPEGK